ncbi:MAG: transglutaminase domain-containing protein [Phycisphaerales bacterium]|nr:transglutaminase-like domain-containing protein [Phycisphaerae bacterium]NNF41828.1 transglutaminase domain-containing protein [Phycisphaerales bacterium]NNM25434.1 transglutaminase domain-containing protein [Phycisphaerales bacterium]
MLAPALTLAAALIAAPPSGRPPTGPLQREQPRLYDIRYDVTLNTAIPYGQDDPRNPRDPREQEPRVTFGGTFELADTPIVMPLIYRGTYSRLIPESIRAELWTGGRRDPGLVQRFRIDDRYPHHGHLAVLPIVKFRGQVIRWNIGFRTETYSSRINDQQAANLAWPREWPDEVADGLRPQLFIESDDPIFKQTVERVSQGSLRMVPPYLAAKDLVRYCLNEVQVVGTGLERGRQGVLHGLQLKGALATARDGRGSPMDLVCVCVAMLRAAGIPARPVIGVEEDEDGRNVPVAWAEFFLQGAGWIPFDPDEMRGNAIRNRDVRQPWPEFGTMDDLNRRIPLAYHFVPARQVQSPMYAALWGWDPRPSGAPAAEQRISISIISRGRGPGDPR